MENVICNQANDGKCPVMGPGEACEHMKLHVPGAFCKSMGCGPIKDVFCVPGAHYHAIVETPVEIPATAPPELTDEYLTHLARALCSPEDFKRDEIRRSMQEKFPESYIPISEATRVFYALIHLEGKSSANTFRLTSFQSLYNGKLADAIFDYAIGAITGELRHATTHVNVHFQPALIHNDQARSSAIQKAIQLNPESLLNTAVQVFGMKEWGGAFGGGNWQNISETTLKIRTLSRLRWIDEIIHCRHCGGSLFDRHIIFKHENDHPYITPKGITLGYRDFLDYRQEGHFEKDLDRRNYTYNDLLNEYQDTIEKVLNYRPVQFGFTELKATLPAQHKSSHISPPATGGAYVHSASKTQKQINSKPFKTTPCGAYFGLPTVKLYISSKYGEVISPELVQHIDNMIREGSSGIYTQLHGYTAKVYILYTYLSKGKQYIRKHTITVKGGLGNVGYKLHKKLAKIIPITNNINSIKVYFDLN